jgi:hypothetical protein
LDGNAQLLSAADENDPDWDTGIVPRLGPKSMREDDAPYANLVPEYTPGQGDTIEPRSGANDRLPYTQVVQQVHARMCDSPILRAFLVRDPDRVRRIVRPPFAHVGELPRIPGVQPNKPVDFGEGNETEEEVTYRDPRAVRAQTYDMRMPPYMRHSMGVPLSITRRQYDLLMTYLDKLEGEWRHTVQPELDADLSEAKP